MPNERRAVAERQARDRQRLLEYPELLRQRDRLQQEIVHLKEAAVEREGAAYEEGVQAGREVPALSSDTCHACAAWICGSLPLLAIRGSVLWCSAMPWPGSL